MGDEWKGLEAYFSNRVVNVMATGALLIQRYTPGLEKIFINFKELTWYTSEQELFENIDYYLKHPEERERIASMGRSKVVASFTYDKSVSTILNPEFRNHNCKGKQKANSASNTYVSNGNFLGSANQIEQLDQNWQTALEGKNRNGRFSMAWYEKHPITKELLKSNVLSGSVLDIGCGTGERAFIAQNRKRCDITGIEGSAFAINRAHARFGSSICNFIQCDIKSLPCKRSSFDNAYMIAVIEHVVDTPKLLSEIRRVIKPGGKILVSVTHNDYHSSPDHVHVFTQQKLISLFHQFIILECYIKDQIIYLIAMVRQS
jgi:ubiquinone/menaquinone biosynthesis C-methylase UbiE